MSNVYGIDIGTSNFKMCCKEKDTILNEKNIIAIANKKDLLAFGDEAYEMYEKAPENIDVSFPVKFGVIAVLFLGWGEAAMEGITLAKLFVFAAVAIGAYVSLLIAYGIGAGSFYKNKHIKAKQRVKKYLRDLSRIEKINNKKEIN